MKQAFPTHLAGMNDGVEISFKALPNMAGFPDILRRIDGHVNHERSPDNILARNKAPIPAVVRIFAIVAHHEVITRRDFVRSTIFLRIRRVRTIRLGQRIPVDKNHAMLDFYRFSGQSNRALDEIGKTLFGQWCAKNDNLLALRIAPQRNMYIRERNAGVVTDARDDQVIPNQDGVFHGTARNYARLYQRAFDKKKGENHPEPRHHFVPDAVARSDSFDFFLLHFLREYRFRIHVSFHDDPPLRVAPAQSDSCRCSTTCKIYLPHPPGPRVAISAKDNQANPRQEISGFLPRNYSRR